MTPGFDKRSAMAIAAVLLSTVQAAAIDLVPGIDVSRWQGNINWTSVKNSGVEFAFVKATEGVDFVDSKFHANMQGARAAGVMVGPYHFCRVDSYIDDPMDPVNEANDFLEAILPYYETGWHLPPVADVEGLPDFPTIAEERAFISNWVQIFSDTIHKKLGVRPLIYTSKSGANTYYTPSVAAGHDLWIAWWKGTGTSSPPLESDTPLWDPWVFWQWTDSSSVPGISGNVDGDVFRGTTEELTQLLLTYMPGDFNHDLAVDAADYTMWRNELGDGYAAADYNLWKTHFGATPPENGFAGGAGSALEGSRGVPEPASLALLSLASVWLLVVRSARRAKFLTPGCF
jgi:lysozyme